jgi:uncharacterized surface protein with fasciclin (FAS1) repeats
MDNNKSTMTAVIIGVLIVAGGLGIFAISRKDKTEKTAETTSSSVVADTAKEKETVKKPTSNIVGLAVATPDLSTLVAAVKAASLVDTLSGTGPFTVFAPTNAAFAALPAGTLDSLLLPENKATLSGILTYHVVPGKVMAKDLSNGQIIKTVNGAELKVEIAGGKVMLVDAKGGKATVAKADIEASNGVVHVIDAVVLPQ